MPKPQKVTIDGKEYEAREVGFQIKKEDWNEYFYQLAAYRQILIEQGYPNLNRARILRFSKDDTNEFEDRLITNFTNEFKLFEHCLAIYNLLKDMNRRL